MTLIEDAKAGTVQERVASLANAEGLSSERLARLIARGRVVVPCSEKNAERERRLACIGESVSIKVNANVGTSKDASSIEEEVEKARVAERYGAHTVMDLSTGGDLRAVRRRIVDEVSIPVGAVPIYEPFSQKPPAEVDADEFLGAIERYIDDGLDFLTIHAGITKESLEHIERSERILGIVSRGGSLTACWIGETGEENPYYANFDYVLDMCKEDDITISLGDALRPGCIADASDRGKFSEFIVLGELVKRARERDVQVMVEGPGHVPIDEIELSVVGMKHLCDGAPLYLLGPVTTDIAPGYDHITSAIGAAVAGMYGADFICMCTRAEHLALPSIEDIKEGTIVTRIAAHIANITRLGQRVSAWDDEMARARAELNWAKQFELAIDPERAVDIHSRSMGTDVCSMCGELCAIKAWKKYEHEQKRRM